MQGSQRLQNWISGGEMRRLAGRRVFVRTTVAEDRPPLLLIHGYPTASYDWVRVWSRLASRYSLYALDLLGFGSSEKPRDCDYPIALQADLCMALLEACGVSGVHVLAHDYGDTVAQELLAREQEGRLRLASMVFLNGGLFPETHRARPVQKLLATPVLGPLLARSMSYGKFEATMRSISGSAPPTREELQDLWVLIERDGGRQALARLINYMEHVDPVSGRHLAERYRELVPDPDVVVLEGVGHYPQLEVHDRVVDEYEAFRSRVDAL